MKKQTRSFFPLGLFIAVAALLFVATGAQAQTPQNPIIITTAPYVITQPGYYRLGNNINYTPPNNNAVNIITVNTSNVTIDLNGFYIAGPTTNAANSVTGIYANERSNLSIFNGTIAYCLYGIFITGNGGSSTNNLGHRIERMRMARNYFVGLYVGFAVTVDMTDNQVNFTGGTTALGANTDAYGIFTDNIHGTIVNNKVSTSTSSGTGTSYGIYCSNSNYTVVKDNKIDSSAVGLRMTPGSSNIGKYQDNLTTNCTTPFTGGTDAGGNN